MKPRTSNPRTRTIIELLIVFCASVGIIGMIQDYFWLTQPQLLSPEKVQLKYSAAVMATIGHLLVVLRRHAMRGPRRNT